VPDRGHSAKGGFISPAHTHRTHAHTRRQLTAPAPPPPPPASSEEEEKERRRRRGGRRRKRRRRKKEEGGRRRRRRRLDHHCHVPGASPAVALSTGALTPSPSPPYDAH